MDRSSSTTARLIADEWADCERELHATAMPDVQRYQTDLSALQAEIVRLRNFNELNQLIDAWPNSSEGDIDRRLRLVRGAAFASRAREIQDVANARLVEERIGRARAADETWVVLQEAGDVKASAAPFSVTTMHIVSGLTTVVMAQYTPMTNSLVYSLSIIRLESGCGRLIDPTPGLEDWFETSDRSELDLAIDRWRQCIESGDVRI